MRPRVLVVLALESILKNKMRAILTMLGIVIGVAAVIVMVAVGYGARSSIRAQIDRLGTNMIVITPGASVAGGVSQGAQAFATLTVKDAEKIRAESQIVAAVSPVIMSRTQVIAAGGNWRTSINGVDTDYQIIRDWQTDAGTFFAPDDVRAARSVAVLGNTVAKRIFLDEDAVGQEIQIAATRFKVTGVLSPKGQTEGDITAAQEEIRTLLRESHALGGDEDDDFTVRNQTELATVAESSTRVMTLLMAAIASISLLVGGIGIMNIMLVSVTERTREIGIRLAIGARGSDVLTQFLVESIVMGMLGGLFGLALGVASAQIIAHFTGWETVISPLVMIVAVGFSGAVGVFFGYYPARKAAALNPIDALRYE